ncbi:MAG: hypothetical protein H6838_04880 [Planctomycetes bacterium]|nr:hypothetical protein [Planctomycetota bacterium]MCB9884802.1 hypothetical protein [Planctomycetota bacterium]
MQRRTLGFLCAAAAIAGCTAVDDAPTPADAGGGHGRPVEASTTAATTPWQASMQQIKEHLQIVRDQLQDTAVADLAAVSAAANAAAGLLSDGYGRYEDRTVPGFARMAREAESWCLQLASEARQGHGAIARELFVTGIDHCKRCHDAVDKVRG